MTVRIINADVMEGLRQLPDESVHCVVTSPPYWGLRDYGVDGQIGLERTLGEHIDRVVEVFREVRRVLRADGVMWVNYGDCYATAPNGRKAADIVNDDRTFRDKPFSTVGAIYDPSYEKTARAGKTENFGNLAAQHGGRIMASGGYLKPKDLCMIPHRIAIALQEDGWWVRADIVWSKPNPMPESIKDRPTKAHEYVFLLAKSERYFFDAEAIREPHATPEDARHNKHGKQACRGQESIRPRGNLERCGAPEERYYSDGGRNKRSVWTIATSPFPEAHFATFPPELPEICIKAGTSQKGCCAKCGAPWERETTSTFVPQPDVSRERGVKGAFNQKPMDASNGWQGVPRGTTKRETVGWAPTCSCAAPTVPATVLDCFSGAGTTCLVADRLQRNAIGIELNPTYAAMSERRINGDRGGLLDLMEAAE